ncbi:hypothetical protein PCANC_10020 [Puccinia coronata f. sp. avenae]|uniref:Uncharacterized protein n=1 Tax=Puccinia coronata f. sp. avenae TaxID=200324 RepID=A0A2N5UZ80_9BASI|nr:hypothetical protein PCANC_10020 [Puccinia coronata f. sp. avenae]
MPMGWPPWHKGCPEDWSIVTQTAAGPLFGRDPVLHSSLLPISPPRLTVSTPLNGFGNNIQASEVPTSHPAWHNASSGTWDTIPDNGAPALMASPANEQRTSHTHTGNPPICTELTQETDHAHTHTGHTPICPDDSHTHTGNTPLCTDITPSRGGNHWMQPGHVGNNQNTPICTENTPASSGNHWVQPANVGVTGVHPYDANPNLGNPPAGYAPNPTQLSPMLSRPGAYEANPSLQIGPWGCIHAVPIPVASRPHAWEILAPYIPHVTHPAPYNHNPCGGARGSQHAGESPFEPTSPAVLEQVSSLSQSQGSRMSEPLWAHPCPETLSCIRETVREYLKGRSDDPGNNKFLLRLAEPLFKELGERQSNQATTSVKHEATGAEDSNSQIQIPTSLKAFVRANTRAVLLRSDLDAYGRRGVRKTMNAKTPFSIMKALIAKQDQAFLNKLPPNYRDDAKWLSQFKSLLTDTLKADKHKLLTIIQNSLPTGSDPRPEIRKFDRARLAYIRLMININRRQRAEKGEGNTQRFWNQIDDNLMARAGKGKVYHLAFAKLIIRKDQSLWNGKRTVNDVTAAKCALPTKAKMIAKAARLLGRPEEEDVEDDDDADAVGEKVEQS